MKKMLVVVCLAALSLSFHAILPFYADREPVPVLASVQRTGNAKAGFEYLTTGDYLRSGIPLSYFKMVIGKSSMNYLKREGLNTDIPYDYTVVNAPNGELVVAPNCMQCHAQVFDGKLIMGLGNSTLDFSHGQKLDPKNAEAAERILKNLDPKKYEAAEPFLRVVKAIGAQMYTKVRGVNTADRLAACLTFVLVDVPKERTSSANRFMMHCLLQPSGLFHFRLLPHPRTLFLPPPTQYQVHLNNG